jgi:hypothetical protein
MDHLRRLKCSNLDGRAADERRANSSHTQSFRWVRNFPCRAGRPPRPPTGGGLVQAADDYGFVIVAPRNSSHSEIPSSIDIQSEHARVICSGDLGRPYGERLR